MALAMLPPDEARLIDYHLDRLGTFRSKNREKYDYYEAKQRVKNLGHSLPPRMRAVEIAVGFSSTVIDTLEERLEFEGWTTEGGTDAFGLDRIYRENDLDVEASGGHLDGLITGSGFVIVGRGEPGEPEALITVESPNRVTGEWDSRLRRLSSALSVDVENLGEIEEVTLFLPDVNIRAKRVGSLWTQLGERDEHGFGRVQVVQLPNKPRGSRQHGRSEITPALRGYTDEAVRTLLGMNVHREFYQAPQRYLLNASEAWFQAADGTGMSGWDAVQGRMLAVPASDDPEDPEPKIGQFAPAPPTPYLEMIRGIAQLVSSEGAIPASYLGFSTDNPPSADAIRALESRLIKKAERRQATFGRGWREVAALALLIRDGVLPEDFYTVSAKWRDPATPTRAAAADEVAKLVESGVLPPDSDVVYNRIGLSPSEKKTLASEKRRADARARLDGLAAAATAARQAAAPPGPATPNAEVTESG